MTQTVQQLIDAIIDTEGGYVDDPNDPGGATRYGITEATARRNGYTGAMSALPRDVAYSIYLQDYYHAPRFDDVAHYAPILAAELTDTGVNMGTRVASEFLQRSLIVMGHSIAADGVIGRRTLDALEAYIDRRGHEGEMVMRAMCDHLQGAHYIEIAEGRPESRKYVYGWIRNRTEVHKGA